MTETNEKSRPTTQDSDDSHGVEGSADKPSADQTEASTEKHEESDPKAEAKQESIDSDAEEKDSSKDSDSEEKSKEPVKEIKPASASAQTTDNAEGAQNVRWVRGGVPLLVGLVVEFCLCAADMQFRWGVPVGIIAVALAAWGALDLAGTFEDPDDRVAHRFKIAELAPQLGAVVGSLLLTLILIGVAVAGHTPVVANAILITAAFLALVVSVYRFGEKLGAWGQDENGQKRTMFQRHGFWVVVAGVVLYLPMLGSYSLSDPWETHYGEVAREILARDDWISTWWAQDGWFWSKPVLNFWTEALSMALFGAGYKPDQMLAAGSRGLDPWPEWAIRMPVFILTIVALYLLYKGVSKVFGRRAGLLGALVLATMPHWFFIGHQTMTDMPFVSAMTSCMGLLLLGLHTDPNKTLRVYEVEVAGTRFRLSAYHLVFGAILMAVIPQVLYLITRNVDLQLAASPHGFRWHWDDVFSAGSGGDNCTLPGNQACSVTPAANKDMRPVFQGLLWTGILVLMLWINRQERRLSRLYFLAAWFFAAVSTMGKGPAGFLLPLLCAGSYVFATAKWKKLLEIEVLSGLLIIACVALPWYVAMYMRHGQPFTDRLLFHDMWKRALTHVHDTNVGDDVSFRFFIWQLGYALFPWTGLVPAGLVWWARRRDDAKGGQGDAALFLAMWFVFAFALFTAMLTKFHHYIFPAVPPAAMLTGVVLDHMIGQREHAKEGKWSLAAYLGSLGLGVGLTIYGVFRLFPGRLMGNVEAESMAARPGVPAIAIPCLLVGVGIVLAGILYFGNRTADPPVPVEEEEEPPEPQAKESAYRGEGPPPPTHTKRFVTEEVLLGGVGVAAAVVVALCGHDLAAKPKGDINGQARLLHLFTYNYGRQWPDSLDFAGMLTAFTLVATGLMLLLVFRKFRHHVVAACVGVGLLWGLWALDIYMVKTAPHWGQRETILAYYKDRKGPEQPIVAYQMNWKGENFYTSNKIPAFVSSGAKFTQWVTDEKAKGVKTMYFVTEHGRRNGLKNELGSGVKSFDAVTTTWLDNKFGLFKAVFD